MSYNDELCHYGVKGMKWGVRRYQNPDGSLTKKGIQKYSKKGYSSDAWKDTWKQKDIKNLAGEISYKRKRMKEYLNNATDEDKAKRAEKYLHDKSQKEKAKADRKKKAQEFVKKNNDRILKEVEEYSKKTGKDYTDWFLKNVDDYEIWDIVDHDELFEGAKIRKR